MLKCTCDVKIHHLEDAKTRVRGTNKLLREKVVSATARAKRLRITGWKETGWITTSGESKSNRLTEFLKAVRNETGGGTFQEQKKNI